MKVKMIYKCRVCNKLIGSNLENISNPSKVLYNRANINDCPKIQHKCVVLNQSTMICDLVGYQEVYK